MKRKFSIYHFLVALMLSTLLLPAFAGAEAQTNDGSLTIHKFEREPGVEDGEDGDGTAGQKENVPQDAIKLEGVTFKITQTHAYDAVNDKWTVIENGQSFEGDTNNEGQAVFAELAYGRYTVEEIAGPPHVILNPNVYSVDIPMTNAEGTELNYNVHIYPKNETIRGGVELTKRDGDTEELLSGVKFKLYNENGMRAVDKNGNDLPQFTTKNGVITVDNLGYGNYYFKEVATIDGYLLGGKTEIFSVTESGVTVDVNVTNYVEPEVTKKVDQSAVNRGETVTYTISVDLPGDIASYKNFTVTDTLDERLVYVVDSASSPTGFTPSYDAGTHTITWTADTSALTGPNPVEFTFQATVAEDAEPNKVINNTAVIEFENQHGNGGEKDSNEVPVTPTAGSLTIVKQDGKTKEKLAGAKFELRDGDKVVAEGSTGTDGKLTFTDIDYGSYKLHETKAPNGYRLLTKAIDVTIDKENANVTITVDNYKSGWQLPKTGGIGTMLFTFIGLSLMGGASFMFVRRRNGEQA